MKLLGFEGHEIISMNYEVIEKNELQELVKELEQKDPQLKKEDENVLVQEEVRIQISKSLDKTLIFGDLLILEVDSYRKISLTIVGEFIFDKGNEEDIQVISDIIYGEYWPMLRKYIPPTVSTLTSITNRGELKIDL